MVVGSCVFTGGAACGCTTGGREQENTVSLPLAVGAAALPAGMDGPWGHGDVGTWGRGAVGQDHLLGMRTLDPGDAEQLESCLLYETPPEILLAERPGEGC